MSTEKAKKTEIVVTYHTKNSIWKVAYRSAILAVAGMEHEIKNGALVAGVQERERKTYDMPELD